MPTNLMDFDPDAQAAPKAANPFTKPATDLMDFDPDAVEQAQPTPQPKQGTISSPRPIPDAMRTMAPRPGPVPDVMRGTVATPEQAPLNPPAPKQSI